jgi:hypothetical protein
VVEDLRDEIDKAAAKVKDSIPDKVKRIRNEVMEEETGKNMDYIERKKRERREKMLKRAEKLYDERLQKRKEFDEASRKRIDNEKPKFDNEKSSGGKYNQSSKKVTSVASNDEIEPRQQKKPSDYKKEKAIDNTSDKSYQQSNEKEMPLSSDDKGSSRQKIYKKEKDVHDETEYDEDESSE